MRTTEEPTHNARSAQAHVSVGGDGRWWARRRQSYRSGCARRVRRGLFGRGGCVARGTNESVGLGREGQAFVDSLKKNVRGKTVGVYAVNYPASDDFLQATSGATDASNHVQLTVATCPRTKIVLGGYSQGAAVIDGITGDPARLFGLGQPMPPEVADHVVAVAVLGNPLNRVGGPLTELSPLYGAKTIDLCNGADPVCSPGDDRPAHSLYNDSGLTDQAADYAAERVRASALRLQLPDRHGSG